MPIQLRTQFLPPQQQPARAQTQVQSGAPPTTAPIESSEAAVVVAQATAPVGTLAASSPTATSEPPTPAPADPLAQATDLVQARLTALGQDREAWQNAIVASMGGDFNTQAAEALRRSIIGKGSDWMPQVEVVGAEQLAGQPAAYVDGRILVSIDVIGRPDALVAALTEEAGRHFGTEINARGAEGTIAEYFRWHVDPAIDPKAARYSADTGPEPEQGPTGMESLRYTSVPEGQIALLHDERHPHYIQAAVGTPPEVADLYDAGAANFATPAWLEQVAIATQRNGGLGNAEDGYLAFDRDFGFVRLKNTNLTPEQNRELAAMSLQTGWPVDKLPSAADKSVHEDQGTSERVERFTDDWDSQLAAFLEDPVENEIALRSGKRRYHLKFDPESGRVVSYNYKKKSGISGFVQRNMDWIGPVLDGISIAVNIIPGIGQAASAAIAAGTQVLKTAATWAATGMLKAQQVVSAVASFVLPSGLGNLTKAQNLTAFAGANVAAKAIDGEDIGFADIGGIVTPMIPGFTGSVAADYALRASLEVAAHAADGGRIGAADVFGAVAPLFLRQPAGDARDQLLQVARDIDGGALTPGAAAQALTPLVDLIANDPAQSELLYQTLDWAAHAIDKGEITATGLVQAALPYFDELYGGLLQDREVGPLLLAAAGYAETGELDLRRLAQAINALTAESKERGGRAA